MSKMIMINPVSGNKNAALLSSSGEVLSLVPKGTILKLVGSDPSNYIVEYDNNEPNRTVGTGYGNTGTIIAYPNTPLYENITKFKIKGYIKNGTTIELVKEQMTKYDQETGEKITYMDYRKDAPYIKIKGKTDNGIETGYVKAKYLILNQEYGYMNPNYYGPDKDYDYYYDGYDRLCVFSNDYKRAIKCGPNIEEPEGSDKTELIEYDEYHYWPTLEERATLEGMSLYTYLYTHFNLQLFASGDPEFAYTRNSPISLYTDASKNTVSKETITTSTRIRISKLDYSSDTQRIFYNNTTYYVSTSNLYIDEELTEPLGNYLSEKAEKASLEEKRNSIMANNGYTPITSSFTLYNRNPNDPAAKWDIINPEQMNNAKYYIDEVSRDATIAHVKISYTESGRAKSTQGWIRTSQIPDSDVKPGTKTPSSTNTPKTDGKIGYITANGSVNVRDMPNTNRSLVVGSLQNGESIAILNSINGFYEILYNGTPAYVSASYVSMEGSQTQANVSKDDATIIGEDNNIYYGDDNGYYEEEEVYTDDRSEWEQAFAELDFNIDGGFYNGNYNEEYYKKLAEKYSYALGAPPRYNMDIDIQYQDTINPGAGRVMNKTILRSPSILSICPGKVTMFPNIIGSQRDSLLSVLLNEASGNESLISKLESDSGGKFSGKMYTFKADTESYSGYLNSLCRACALLMGIGDKVMPHTSTKLKEFDYSYWTIRKRYSLGYTNSIGETGSGDTDTSLWKRFMGGLLKEARTLKNTATDSTIYINFFLSGGESSVSESISTDVEESPVKGLVDGVSDVGKKINYFTGSGFAIGGEDLEKGLSTILNTNGGIGLLSMAENFLKGGRMIFPKMVGSAAYGQEVSCSMKFVSPYGDRYSIFLRCIVPLCHILAMALPRQLSDNMFTFPFVVKAFQLGQFNIELGVINSLSIRRGGDDTSWTVDGLATEWNVDFTIIPLVDELMITSEKNPFLFMKNNNLIAYLCNFCGFDALSYSMNVKADIMRSFIRNRVYSIPRSLGHRLDDIMYNKINSLLTLNNGSVW